MKRYTKTVSIFSMLLLLAGLLPIVYLGTFNHPSGDDYFYGVETHHVWEATHRLAPVLSEACRGVAEQYQIWQGTYSAMFLMYLPPNTFGEGAYHLVTGCILLLLCGSIFYLLRRILCGWLKASAAAWTAISSVIAMLWVQTVDFQSESFFWYNGSMYYTGFFALTLFFFGLLCGYLQQGGRYRIALLCLLALILAGGNYVTFLPAFLVLFVVWGILIRLHKKPQVFSLSIVNAFALAGFAVNAAAPGNRIRQDGMWQISPILAILKSLRQGIYFLTGMTDLWFVIGLLVITPILWTLYQKLDFRFRCPVIVMGFAYGVMCSAFCPTFYTMNSTGPARAVAVMYYLYVLFVFFCYAYGLGYVQRVWKERSGKNAEETDKPESSALSGHKWQLSFGLTLFVLTGIQILSGAWRDCTATRAVRCLASGNAAAYEAEYQERLRRLSDPSETEIVFKPYQVQADLLYVGDLTGDPEHPTNQRVAEYFDKKSVMVDWE